MSLMTTAEVADYLRLKERTVYEMVAREQIPCSRATGKLLFSRQLIDAWVEAHTEMPLGKIAATAADLRRLVGAAAGMGAAPVRIGPRGADRRVAARARGHRPRRGGARGRASARRRERRLQPRRRSARWCPQRDIVAIHWARRAQGLLLAPGNPHRVTSLADAVGRGLRLARRRDGSGSRALLDALLARDGLARARAAATSASPRARATSRR